MRFLDTQAYLVNFNKTDNLWVALDNEVGNYPSDSPVMITAHRSPLTAHRSPLTAHRTTDVDGQHLKVIIRYQQKDPNT